MHVYNTAVLSFFFLKKNTVTTIVSSTKRKKGHSLKMIVQKMPDEANVAAGMAPQQTIKHNPAIFDTS
jgi:hypothetical protein